MTVIDDKDVLRLGQGDSGFLESCSDEPEDSTMAVPSGWYMDRMTLPAGPEERSGSERSPQGPSAGLGNTAIATSQESVLPWEVAGGVDKLEVTCFGDYDESYGQLCCQLEAAKQAAMDGLGHRRVDIDGGSLYVGSRGHRWASTFMEWIVEFDGIKISLRRRGQSPSCPVAKVELSSLKLMRDGHVSAWEQACRMLASMGVLVERTTVARLDLCVDLAGVPVDGFCEAVNRGGAISRIRSSAAFYRNETGGWQGVVVGSIKGARVACYDKIQELAAKPGWLSDAKRDVLVVRRWGVLPEVATRVEVQMSGSWLRRKWANMSSVEEVFASLDAIMGYMLEGYFRLVEGTPDRENNNQDRAVTSDLWETVTASFREWVGGLGGELRRKDRPTPDKARLVRRLLSAAVSLGAISPRRVGDKRTFLQAVCDELAAAVDEDELGEMIGRKRAELDRLGVWAAYTFEERPPGEWSQTYFGEGMVFGLGPIWGAVVNGTHGVAINEGRV